MPLRFEPDADAEIVEAFEWYRARSPSVARIFLDALDTTIMRAGRFPEQFPLVRSEIRRAMVPGFPYAVFFVAETDVVRVIGVVHGKRHPRRWQSRA